MVSKEFTPPSSTTSSKPTKSSAPKRPAFRSGLLRGIGRPSGKPNSWRAGTLGIVLGLLLGQPLAADTVKAGLSILRLFGVAKESPSPTPPATTSSSSQISSPQ